MATCQPDSLWSGFQPLIDQRLLLKHRHTNTRCSVITARRTIGSWRDTNTFVLLSFLNQLTRCLYHLDWGIIGKQGFYNNLDWAWILLCKPDMNTTHAQKQWGEELSFGQATWFNFSLLWLFLPLSSLHLHAHFSFCLLCVRNRIRSLQLLCFSHPKSVSPWAFHPWVKYSHSWVIAGTLGGSDSSLSIFSSEQKMMEELTERPGSTDINSCLGQNVRALNWIIFYFPAETKQYVQIQTLRPQGDKMSLIQSLCIFVTLGFFICDPVFTHCRWGGGRGRSSAWPGRPES